METTWKIKPNAVWHDGAPVTARDMLFTATVAQDKSLTMAQDTGFKFVEGIDAPDPQTVVVRWKSTYVDADKLFTQTTSTRNLPMPSHLLEPVYDQDRATFTDSTYFGADYMGTGPYRLKQVIADEWARVGLVGEPLVVPEQRISDRVYQAAFPGFYFRFGGSDQLTDWQSKEAPSPENNYVGRNPIRYQNPDYDILINQTLSTIRKPDRMKLLAEMLHISTDQLLLITLYHEPEPVLLGNRLVNVGGRRGQNIQAWNAQLWDVQ